MAQPTISQAARVEDFCAHRSGRTIHVSASDRFCINCIWYEQYFHRNHGNVYCFVPTSRGRCLLHEQERGPMRQPCKKFEKKEVPRS